MSALVALALNAGVPILERVLSKRLGPATGEVAAEVIRAIAERAGTTPDAIEDMATSAPGRVIEAMREVERGPVAELLVKDAEARMALIASEAEGPVWVSAWRPAGMYLLGFLWLWNIVLLHVANAIWKVALPPVGFDILIQISGLYMGLYMGGHTVKDLAAKWKASS
jgi:hypothetical protein